MSPTRKEVESMSRRFNEILVAVCIAMTLASGCQPAQPFYFLEDGDLSHYKGVATEIEYPDLEVARLAEVDGVLPPLTVVNSEAKQIWDLTLEEVIQITLKNSKTMRIIGPTTGRSVDNLLRNGDFAPTIYDPAIVEANPRTGVEAALSAFDAQLSTSTFWERNERPVNISGPFTALLAPALDQDLATHQTQIAKTGAAGTQMFLRNNTSYDFNTNPSNLFPSAWNTNVEVEVRQPLLQGAGVEFNRIAGPNSTPGFFFSNGVALARIDTDIELTEFEANVRDVVRDAERAYWELYFTYRDLDAKVAGRDGALQTWRRVYALYTQGARGGSAEEEAQAREQYLLFRSQVELAQTALLGTESQLRYIMGLAAADGRLIRPADEPTSAQVVFDWCDIVGEGLVRSVELRKQKWRIKRRELELIGARNFLLPRLDVVGRYRWLGLGDDLIDSRAPNSFDNAWQNLTGGDFQEWQLGYQFTWNIGFRQGLSAVRSSQLQLARDRAVLQDQELELTHLLADAFRQIDSNYTVAGTNFTRRSAAQRQVEAVNEAYNVGLVTLDVVLDAQRRLSDAESQYFRALVDYNTSIVELHSRKGSLLEYNGVTLAEGPWPAKAYFDAHQRARERDASVYLNYGFTRPQVISRGPFLQHHHMGDQSSGHGDYEGEMIPDGALPEVVPVPQPIPDPAFEEGPQIEAPSASSASYIGGPGIASAPRQAVGPYRTNSPSAYEGYPSQPPRGDYRTAAGGPRFQR